MTKLNQYNAAEANELGKAAGLILGEKPVPSLDTVVGDPDTMHRPESFAEGDE